MTVASVSALSDHLVSGDQAPQAFVSGQTVKDALSGLSTFMFSCGCLLVIPALFEDMGDRGGRKNLPYAIGIAHICILLVFLGVALPGYLAFGTEAQSNFLEPTGLMFDKYWGAWLAATIAVFINLLT